LLGQCLYKLKKQLWLIFIFIHTHVYSQVNIRKNPNSGTAVTENFGKPLANSATAVYQFCLVCLAILGLVQAFRIYTKWQNGERDVIGLIFRWFIGMVIAYALIWFANEVLIDGWGKNL
jgi:hypothetical protein